MSAHWRNVNIKASGDHPLVSVSAQLYTVNRVYDTGGRTQVFGDTGDDVLVTLEINVTPCAT